MRPYLVGFLCCVVVLGEAGCRPRVPCSESAPCPVDQYCLADLAGEMSCMDQCDPDRDGTVCPNGALCVPNGVGTGVCWTGGFTPIGGNCTSQRDCTYGAICVGMTGTMDSECYAACDLDGSWECSDVRQTCVATIDGAFGLCVP